MSGRSDEPMPVVGRVGVAMVAAALAACGGGHAQPTVEVTDSAGIPVYSLRTLPPWDAPEHRWRLTIERSIPTADRSPTDEPLLYRPQAYARLADGTLVVLDGGQLRLAVLDPTRDTVVQRFARTGQGPGEIWSSNATLWSAGDDAFWVMDPGNQRLSRFRLTGELEEEVAMPIPGVGGVVLQDPVDHLPWLWKIFLADPEARTLTDSVGRLDLASRSVDFIAPLPSRVPSRASGAGARLLDPLGWFAPLGTGGFVTGRSDLGLFTRYSDQGEVVGLLRVPMRPAPIPEARKVEILEEFYGLSPGARAVAREVGDHYNLYDIMWGVGDSLFALQQGRLSTPDGEPPIPDDQRVWRLFSPTGAYAGAVVFPEGVAQPYWIEPGRIVATRRDSLGVATIVSYLLTPPAGM